MKLKRAFYARPCLDVARALIGKWLVHEAAHRRYEGRIVETEAYIGEEDQACHARFGRTKRAEVLFGPPGHAYVFLIYGMYDCFNVVTEPEGKPAAVLVRAVEPGAGVEHATDGPGKLCRALHISRVHNRADLTSGPVYLEDRGGAAPRIAATERIGVEYAGEWARRLWRLVDADSKHLSRRLKH
jgi:DNA-3-methyladenine glycosylase